LLCREELTPKLITIPSIDDYDEITWISIKPKVLPRPLSNILVCNFYYSPGQHAEIQRKFVEKLRASAEFSLSKFPNVGILLLGDTNELKLEYLCRGPHLKQVVYIPTTKGGSSLDVICTNLHKFYSQPEALPPLGGSYHIFSECNHWIKSRSNTKSQKRCIAH